jgi:GNAT superfamily N-acetyltransferase
MPLIHGETDGTAGVECDGAVSAVSANDYLSHEPDAHLERKADGVLRARCSIWWRSTPRLAGDRVGFIGHYAASDVASGQDVLHHACERLRAERCAIAIGPIDGSTWRTYRFVSDRVLSADGRPTQPRFLLEPDNPDAWPAHFEAAGLRTLTNYSSTLMLDLDTPRRAATIDSRCRASDISIRTLDATRSREELGTLYRLSTASFADNFLYTPISEAEFEHQYHALLPFVTPSLVSIAERDGNPVGFVFAIPDALEHVRSADQAIQTIIIKTLAVVPHCRGMGLGTLLFDRTNAIAAELGYTRAIHALMHDGNPSQRISGNSHTIRRYALYARPL